MHSINQWIYFCNSYTENFKKEKKAPHCNQMGLGLGGGYLCFPINSYGQG